MTERTTVLAKFRDTYLDKHEAGRWLTKTYYEYSPSMADFIADRGWLRALVRVVLTPLVGCVSLLM